MKQIFIFCLLAATLLAQGGADELKISGQVQLRTELDGRDFSNKTYPLTFSSMRTRLNISRAFGSQYEVFAQVQDSRVFGEEMNTIANTKNLDLHQAYVVVNNPVGLPVTLQAGRFELVQGTERFLGAVGWHYIGRSWDGVRLNLLSNAISVFGLTHSETVPYISAATPATYALPAAAASSFSVYGIMGKTSLSERVTLEPFAYYESNRNKSNGKDADISRFTAGLTQNGNYGPLASLLEFAYQGGKLGSKTVAAYLLSVSAAYKMQAGLAGIGVDWLSGNSPADSGKSNCFSTPFGTNHKFYGFMDYFTNIPLHTGSLGLHDFYGTFTLAPNGEPYSVSVAVHHFTTDKQSAAGLSAYGQEVDLTLKYLATKNLQFTWGGSVFLPGELMKSNFKTAGGAREDAAYWSYLMLTAGF